jgi:hypothetical protein
VTTGLGSHEVRGRAPHFVDGLQLGDELQQAHLHLRGKRYDYSTIFLQNFALALVIASA